ncbi:transposable element Tcb2 transposase [Trichonephila clavipes]|nr:transposable element Tcb2 transposase [Trichonephila clavipes]
MNSRRDTSENERALVIKWSKDGKSLREIASLIEKSHGCIQNILQKYRRTGCVAKIPGRGRKEILNGTAKRKIICSVKKNPLLSAPKLASSISSKIGGKISAETIRCVLRNAGFHSRTPVRKSLINCVNRKKILSFAKEHISKPESFWRTLLFSLMKANLIFTGTTDSRQVGKELNPKNTIKKVKYGGSVLVLGVYVCRRNRRTCFIDGIMDKMVYLEILKNNLQKSSVNVGLAFRENLSASSISNYDCILSPFFIPHPSERNAINIVQFSDKSTEDFPVICYTDGSLGSNFIFQQVNDPKHTAKTVKLYLLYHCKKELHTPPQSPDLNVIENSLSQLEKSVHEHAITSKEDLKKVLKEEWTKITAETTKILVESMPKRLQAAIKAKGFATKY